MGYWIFDGDDNLLPHANHLDWLMDMALKYNLQVLIDLHGHKGSQNGNDHSGRSGKAEWFNNESNINHSLDVLEKIAHRYVNHPRFWGLQLINEPKARVI